MADPRRFTTEDFWSRLIAQKWTHDASLYSHNPPPVVDRANRVSVLIDSNDCRGAEALARSEGDTQMARRVPLVCEARRRGLL